MLLILAIVGWCEALALAAALIHMRNQRNELRDALDRATRQRAAAFSFARSKGVESLIYRAADGSEVQVSTRQPCVVIEDAKGGR